MTKPLGSCVFCGQLGNLTKGHIWADWIKRLLAFPSDHNHIYFTEHFAADAAQPIISRMGRQGTAVGSKRRNTCATCNNGWMSRFEQAALPVCRDLILGNDRLLRPVDQWALASFLCLMSMRISQFSRGINDPIPQIERDFLRMHGVPPRGWRIWIMRLRDDRADEHWTLYSDRESMASEHYGQSFTMVIGQLCAHVMRWPGDGFGKYEGIVMTQIWPAVQFDIDGRAIPTVTHVVAEALHRAIERERYDKKAN